MLSKSTIKFVKSLQLKKNRIKESSFVVEGDKMVNELLQQNRYQIRQIFALESWIGKHLTKIKDSSCLQQVTSKEMDRLSSLRSHRSVIAVVSIPENPRTVLPNSQLCLVLDHIQDPGNLGTIIRLADWFNIQQVICSEDCVDLYNPKVIQATMGSFLRVSVRYESLIHLFKSQSDVKIWVTSLKGEPLRELSLDQPTYVVIGNEGHGIRDDITALAHKSISIEKFGKAESLNVAMATSIICYALS